MKNYQHRDYLIMIIRGLIYNYDYLPQYIIREQKKAENNNIDFSEFIGRTIKVIEDLEGEFVRLRNKKRDVLETQKNGKNDSLIEKQIENLSVADDFVLSLELYTDRKFTGNLGFWDLNKIRIAINEAFNFYSFEKEEDENRGPIEYFEDKDIISETDSRLISIKRSEEKLNEKFISHTWFKIGVNFATGKAQELYEKYKQDRGHFTKVATELGFKETDRPYISETINNSTWSNKNIYSSPEKIKKIYRYCQNNNIEVCSDFLDQLTSK